MENCYFESVCSSRPCDKAGCIRYLEFNALIEKSKLPKRYVAYTELTAPQVDLEAYNELHGLQMIIDEFVLSGKQIYLWSRECGNGKTTWASKLLKAYFAKIWPGNQFKMRGYFVHVPTFLERLKDNISDKNDVNEIKASLRNADLVIWDDIAVKNISEFEIGVLLHLIDYRVSNLKANIYTSNLAKQKLEALLGPRLASRIYNASKVIQFHGTDRRGKNG